MKRLVKVLLLSAAMLAFTLVPGGAYGQGCPTLSICDDGICVVCFPIMRPGGGCAYLCEIVS